MKALNGCNQASKLWNNKIMKFLRTQGYEQYPIDPCVLNRIHGEKIYLLLVNVDDIIIVADAKEVQRLKEAFEEEFKWITVNIGRNILTLVCSCILKIGF